MIDDDELKKLFDDSDDDKEETKEDLPDTSAPEKEEKAKVFDDMEPSKEKTKEEPKKEKPKKAEPKEPVKKETHKKDESSRKKEIKKEEPKKEEVKKPTPKKDVPKKEAPKKIEPEKEPSEPFGEKVQKLALKMRDKLAELKEKRDQNKSDIPLKEREYLPNFPLSFKGTLWILLGVSVILLIWSFFFQPFFRVKNIEIEGNIVLPDEQLISDSGIKYDSHLFSHISGDPLDIVKLDYGKIEDRMKERDPYIKDIQITVKFPSTIRMKVTERNKVAYIKMPDGYAAIDDEGTVIELETLDQDNLSHAVICGLEVSGAVKGKKIDIKNTEEYDKALVVLGAIITADLNGGKDEYQMFKNVDEIRIIPGGNIFLTIDLPSGTELQVKLKDISNINEDMSWLRYAVIKDSFKDLEDGAFDMTGDTYIYRKYEK